MTFKQRALQALALCAIAGLVAGCGGGGGGSAVMPGSPTGKSPILNANASHVTVFVPSAGMASYGKRHGQYVSGSGTSSLVVSVVPSDPAEAAQWSTLYGAAGFSACYSLFTNGAASAPAPITVTAVPGGFTVTNIPMPSPPGQDTFTITQYAGTCTNAYTAPTPPVGQTLANTIISQSPPLIVYLTAGVANNFNVLLNACGYVPGSTQPAATVCAVPPNTGLPPLTPILGASIQYVYLAQSSGTFPFTLPAAVPLPIVAPMREQNVFTTAGDFVGFPLPVVGLDGQGNVVPFTAPVLPNTTPTSGMLPKNTTACTGAAVGVTPCPDFITITETEAGPTSPAAGTHFKFALIDATTGAIAQNPGTSVRLTMANAIDVQDNVTGAATPGDPYMVVATFDGSPAAASTSVTATLTGTLNGVAITSQTLTITPQSSLFTAVAAGPANGYTDASAAYTSAADILNIPATTATVAAGGQGYWVSDAGKLHQVGTAPAGGTAVAGATSLGAMTLFNPPAAQLTLGRILVVDNAQAANAGSPGAAIASGIYVFEPAAKTSKPLAVQDLTTGNWVAFGAPQAIAYVTGGYVYVDAGNAIYAIDPTSDGAGSLATQNAGALFSSEEIGQLPVTGLSGNAKGFDMIASGTKLIFTDTGNNRIVSIDTATCVPGGAACTPTVIASGHPFVGLAVNGGGYVATDTAGQIYTISSSGTVTSLGLANGAAPKDGVVGVIGATSLVPVSYTTQGQTANVFGSASVATLPYTLPPFPAQPAPYLAAGAQAAVAGGVLKFAPDTSNATFGATGGVTTSGFGIAFVSAAGANTALTSNSYLFTDNGALRTLVP